MTLDDKEINFWLRYGKEPQFCKEIGMDWDEIIDGYEQRLKNLEIDEIKSELIKYKTIISNLTNEDVDIELSNIWYRRGSISKVDKRGKRNDISGRIHFYL